MDVDAILFRKCLHVEMAFLGALPVGEVELLELAVVKVSLFKEINKFRNDVAIMRNMHQHHIEYLKARVTVKGEIQLYDMFVADRWIGSCRTKRQCFDALRQAGCLMPDVT
jgi:hypothetical protein